MKNQRKISPSSWPYMQLPLLALLLAAGPSSASSEQDSWKRVSKDDGITVFSKEQEEGSAVVSVGGEAEVDASLAEVLAVLSDNQLASEWMPYVQEKHNLIDVSDNERIEYTHVAMPWPLSDRYFINSGKLEKQTNGAILISVKSVESPDWRWLEEDKILGRMKYSKFLLTPVGDKKTRIALEVNVDPNGLIPKWMVNLAQKSWPRDFLKGLRSQLAKKASKDPRP